MSPKPPPPLIVPAIKKHTATVIMSHGLGDSGAGWVFLAQNWRRRQNFEEVKFIFPNAPMIPITANGGMTMPGWYDIMGFADLSARNDEVGIKHSQAYIHSLVEAEISSGIPSTRIVLCGFSQGGAISLFSGLTSPKPLGGIVGLSCYLLLHDTFKKFIPQDDPNRETPIFMGHGDIDSLVLPKWGQMSKDMLSADGYKVDLKFYKGLGHSADPEEIDDVEKYLNERIPPLEDKQAL